MKRFDEVMKSVRTTVNNGTVGAIAGATGALALDMATSLDMALRGRAPSDVPAMVVEKVATRKNELLAPLLGDAPERRHRRSGVGALAGYGVGIALGAIYGMRPTRKSGSNWLLNGTMLGLAALIASDVPAVRLGATDVRKWSVSDWTSDILPHAVYGLATAAVFARLAR